MFSKAKKQASTGSFEYLIVGLGNPGAKYETTRHNVGFNAIDRIAEKEGIAVSKLKYKSLIGDGMIAGHRVLLQKPQTFMNLSGEAVRDAMQFYKIPPENVIVIFDDISLDVGRMRIRRKGSDGGHNGIKNIIYLTGSDQYPRIKVGVGKKPHPDYDLADWVLSSFKKEEQDILNSVYDDCYSAICLMLDGKTDMAMNKFNTEKK
ncbi:MAG: aminoacyl-tRNA hydrolase [Oscillospiraceae bacterium]|nr:aminoacyl-tRNA hydrolase [Oscillospiraceae bacterium]